LESTKEEVAGTAVRKNLSKSRACQKKMLQDGPDTPSATEKGEER